MANFYDKASLVLIPSGTKEGVLFSQKPTNGDGDFTFSRSTSATRVGPSGYIEKETQNLLLQSNQFDTTWSPNLVSVTGGQSGYDGSSDAWLLQDTASIGEHRVRQSPSQYDVVTLSVYAKANTLNYLWLRGVNSGINVRAYFNLSTGTLGTSSGTLIDYNIESAGNGWYRCSLTLNQQSGFEYYIGLTDADGSASYIGTGSGSIYIQDAQLEQGLVARDYIETTTSAVYGGITDNIPRLDYTDASCPSLLLEPQRTNIATQSEAFTDTSCWATTNLDIIANDAMSPEGVQNASFLRPTAINGGHQMYHTFSISAGTNTLSVFIKAGNYSKFRLYFYDGTTAHEVYGDCIDGSIHSTNSTASVEDYGNGWYRYSVTATNVSYGTGNYTIRVVNDSYQDSWLTNGTDGLYIYGWQFESGSYATSYIPTYGSAVTAAKDDCSVTGVSDLIGQTEGTMFAEVQVTLGGRLLLIGTSGNFIELVATSGGIINAFVYNGSTQVNLNGITTFATGDTIKVAFAYKANDFVLYVNGTANGTDTSGAIPSSMAQIIVNDYLVSGYNTANGYKQALLFKTRLSNEELAALTTI